jgi:HNH endonuclease
MPLPAPLADRFWSKVDKRGPDECWPWLGSRQGPNGHGKILLETGRNSTTNAHRVSWMLHFGPIPDGIYVLHNADCDHPWCVNPRHLHLGTHADNMREAGERGLLSVRVGPKNARWLVVDEESIQARYLAGESQQAIADDLGIGQSSVSRIIRGDRQGRHHAPTIT